MKYFNSMPINRFVPLAIFLLFLVGGCKKAAELPATPTTPPTTFVPTQTPTTPHKSPVPTKIPTTPPTTLVPTNTPTPAPTPMPSDQVWFAPNMGSRDLPELFSNPEQWEIARSKIDVFMFYPQLIEEPCSICGENTYEKIVEVGAFQKLRQAGIAVAVEAGAVKEWGCTSAATFGITKRMIQKVAENGGEVTILAMDEPLIGGQHEFNGQTCGYEMEKSAAETRQYIKRARTAYPDIMVGDIEPYPHYSVAELEQWILLVLDEGTTLDFFHLDVDIERVRVEKSNLRADLQELSQFCEEHSIPFGVILTSNWTAAGSDKGYYYSTLAWIKKVNDVLGKPKHVIFQSWLGPAANGMHEVPINLPENDPNIFSHTRLIIEGLTVFGE